ncbi:MAG: Flp pilus assembly protein CpaB [Planctomycetota bacterium]
MTNKLALVVAVTLGILSIVGIRLYIERVQTRMEVLQTPVPVWVATQDLSKGTKFEPDTHAQEDSVPKNVFEKLAKTCINDPRPYQGAPVVADVAPGQVLQSFHFNIGGEGASGTLKGRLLPGYRAFSLPVDAITGVSGFLRPGDRIDISATMEFKDALGASNVKLKATRTVVKNVEVLATGRITSPDDPRAGRSAFETITIALRPEERNKVLHVYLNKGLLVVSLKDPGDGDPSGWSTVTDDTIFKEIKDELR